MLNNFTRVILSEYILLILLALLGLLRLRHVTLCLRSKSNYCSCFTTRSAWLCRGAAGLASYRRRSSQSGRLVDCSNSVVQSPHPGNEAVVLRMDLDKFHENVKQCRKEYEAKRERGEVPPGISPPSLPTEKFFQDQECLRVERENRFPRLSRRHKRDDMFIRPGEDDEAFDRLRGIDYVDKTTKFPNPTSTDPKFQANELALDYLKGHLDPPLPPIDPSFPPPHPNDWIPMEKDPVLPLLRTAVVAAHQRKGDDIVAFRSRYAEDSCGEFFMVCHGYSHPQLHSICDGIEEAIMRDHGVAASIHCGLWDSGWLMMQFDFLVVSVMTPYTRIKKKYEEKPGVEFVNVRYIIEREERKQRRKKEREKEKDLERKNNVNSSTSDVALTEMEEDVKTIEGELMEMSNVRCVLDPIDKDGIWGDPDTENESLEVRARRRRSGALLEQEFYSLSEVTDQHVMAHETEQNDRYREGGSLAEKWDSVEKLQQRMNDVHRELKTKKAKRDDLRAKFGEKAGHGVAAEAGVNDEELDEGAAEYSVDEMMRDCWGRETVEDVRLQNWVPAKELEELKNGKDYQPDPSIFWDEEEEEEAKGKWKGKRKDDTPLIDPSESIGNKRLEEPSLFDRDMSDPFWA